MPFGLIVTTLTTFGMTLALTLNASGQTPAPMRTVRGKHVLLKADSQSQESLQELADAFDAAVPQWERFWQLPPGTLDQWQVDAFVMNDVQRFRDSGDLPEHLQFPFGYAIDSNLWVRHQQSDYYTRHLLLHEGVHSLAIKLFGGTGPSWYAEGLAEMLGVHRGTGSQVEINVVPQSRQSTPYWGRFKVLSELRSQNRIPTLETVFRYPIDLKSDVEPYGWSWVAAMLLCEYPEYRPAMLAAARAGSDRSDAFSAALKRQLASQWPIVQARWRMLTQTIDYGFDWPRERIELSMNDELWRGKTINTTILADRGWQSVGVRFAPGMHVHLSARGQCVINDDPKPWISQPAGVTIHYANDRPLGQLLVCILPNTTDEQGQLDPLPISVIESESEIAIDKHCWLLMRINDDLGDLGNNQGGYSLSIHK